MTKFYRQTTHSDYISTPVGKKFSGLIKATNSEKYFEFSFLVKRADAGYADISFNSGLLTLSKELSDEIAEHERKLVSEAEKDKAYKIEVGVALDTLPAITEGSPKQIAWAEKIRATKVECYLDQAHDAEKFLSEVGKLQNAKFWIDNRDIYYPIIGPRIEAGEFSPEA